MSVTDTDRLLFDVEDMVATITLNFAPDSLAFTIRDDGQGFIAPQSPANMTPNGHFGLLGIQERAELIGATFTINSALNEGTELMLRLPLEVPYR